MPSHCLDVGLHRFGHSEPQLLCNKPRQMRTVLANNLLLLSLSPFFLQSNFLTQHIDVLFHLRSRIHWTQLVHLQASVAAQSIWSRYRDCRDSLQQQQRRNKYCFDGKERHLFFVFHLNDRWSMYVWLMGYKYVYIWVVRPNRRPTFILAGSAVGILQRRGWLVVSCFNMAHGFVAWLVGTPWIGIYRYANTEQERVLTGLCWKWTFEWCLTNDGDQIWSQREAWCQSHKKKIHVC